jgi:phosphoglycolate phosphatase
MRRRAVLFDLDGTLVHSAPDLAAAANRMRAAFGLPPLTVERVADFIGKGIPMLVRRALADDPAGTAEEGVLPRALALYETFYAEESGRQSAVYPGVREGLAALAEAGIALGVVTNKSARFTEDLLRQLDLIAPFGVVVSGDTLAARKPDPAPLQHAFERLGVRPAEGLMLGDSANDVAAARAAGCDVWCVSYGYREGAPVAALGADRIVASVHEAALALAAGAA